MEPCDERRAELARADALRWAEQELCDHPRNAISDLKWGYRCKLCGKINP